MTPHDPITERRLFAAALLTVGLALTGWAGVSLVLALDHMAGLAALCGGSTSHCAWCASALGGAIAAAAAIRHGLILLTAPCPKIAQELCGEEPRRA